MASKSHPQQVRNPDDRLNYALKEIREFVAIDLQRVGDTGDTVIDGIIWLDKLGLARVYVQAKRWQGTIGRRDLQAFYGALTRQKAKQEIFITTSSYTVDAIDFAKSVEGFVVIDSNCLVNLMIVGVSAKVIKLPKLDMDYFE